jgi:cytidylate kinase
MTQKINEIFHIAIDGPVASGKGTVARTLSERLGIPCLDTGAMYRAFAVHIREKGVIDTNEAAVLAELPKVAIETRVVVRDGSTETQVFVNGRDVTPQIRDNAISQIASNISRYTPVREKMVALQQEIAKTQSFILEGRDIASVVLPDAKFKIYLTASLEVRAKRRQQELAAKGTSIDLKEMMLQIELRDHTDRNKPVGALVCVPDAITIDNSDMTREQTVDAIYDLVTR